MLARPTRPARLARPMRLARVALALVALTPLACGNPSPSRPAVNRSIQSRIVHDETSISIAGEQLILPAPVARFYRARQFRASWNPNSVPQVVAAIKQVYEDGLNPADYHVAAIQRLDEQRKHASTAELEADLDLLLTDAVAAIFDHVRYGKVHPRDLDPRWNVDPRDGAPPLENQVGRVVGAEDPVAAIQAEKPDHFIYKGLVGALARMRQFEAKGGWAAVPDGKPLPPGAKDKRIPLVRKRLAISGELGAGYASSESERYDAPLIDAVKLFQARYRLAETGVIDAKTVATLNVSAAERAAQVRVNLERARWVLAGLKGDFVLVNLAAFKAYLIQGGQNLWEARTQIGKEARQTPTFRAMLRTVVFNPDWTVPPSIAGGEVLKEPPGPENPLGRVKFVFPNRYAIYLHDRPRTAIYDIDERTFGNGCIRVENAEGLAAILLKGQGWNRVRIARVIAGNRTENVELTRMPYVLIVYWTVSVGVAGEVRYADDVYTQDQALLNRLNAPSRAP